MVGLTRPIKTGAEHRPAHPWLAGAARSLHEQRPRPVTDVLIDQIQYRPALVEGCLAGTGLSLNGGPVDDRLADPRRSSDAGPSQAVELPLIFLPT